MRSFRDREKLKVDDEPAAPKSAEARAGVPGEPSGDESAPGPSEAGAPGAESKLAEQIAKLQEEKEELLRMVVRRQADFENYRKRVERERREDRDRISAALIELLLPVLDGFERALAAHREPAYEDYRKGFELLYRQLQEVLSRQGLTRLDVVGQPFDPHYHHAVERVESDEYPDGTVIEELQAGYKFRDRVLRPAMVRVAAPRTTDAELGVN